jgi:hypothetical protein
MQMFYKVAVHLCACVQSTCKRSLSLASLSTAGTAPSCTSSLPVSSEGLGHEQPLSFYLVLAQLLPTTHSYAQPPLLTTTDQLLY